MNTDDRNGVLGGRGDAWCYGALVKGRVVYTEDLDVEALGQTLRLIGREMGLPLVCVVPADDASDEAACVIGTPVALATLDDDAGNQVTLDVSAEALRAGALETLPAAVWARLTAETGLEPEGEDTLYLAPGGWSQARLEIGDRTFEAYSENDPPAEPVALDIGVPAQLTVSAA
ncbi:MAG: hypothetical protein EVA89_31550 [Sandaracinaceae bacterium]|nr:MAG: hypothetical protein EVA89_31550 [Sandaracinaceae bacterium]